MPRHLKNAAFALALMLLASHHAYAQEVFATFENQAEITSIKASDSVRLAASKRFPAWNVASLEAAFPAAAGWERGHETNSPIQLNARWRCWAALLTAGACGM